MAVALVVLVRVDSAASGATSESSGPEVVSPSTTLVATLMTSGGGTEARLESVPSAVAQTTTHKARTYKASPAKTGTAKTDASETTAHEACAETTAETGAETRAITDSAKAAKHSTACFDIFLLILFGRFFSKGNAGHQGNQGSRDKLHVEDMGGLEGAQ